MPGNCFKSWILKTYSSSRLVFVVFISALVLGLAGYYVYRDIPVDGDALLHKRLGLEVASGSWLSSEDFGYVETPGYPFILGIIYKACAGRDIWVKLVQVIIFALSAGFVFLLSNLVFNRFVGLLSSLWYITYYDFVSSAYQIMREVWIAAFILMLLFLAVLYFKKGKIVNLVLCALSFGYLVLIDPRYCFYSPVLLGFVIYHATGWRHKLRDACVVIVGIALFLVPWAVRQSLVYRKPVMFSYQRDSQMLSFLGFRDVVVKGAEFFSVEMSRDDYLRDLHGANLPASTRSRIEKKLTDEYIHEMQAKVPRSVSGILLHRILEYWRFARFDIGVRMGNDMRFEFPWSLSKNISNAIHIGLLLPFFIVGGYFIIRHFEFSQFFVLSVLLYHFVFHVLVHYLYRYRLPVLPIVFMIGWYGFSVVTKLVKEYDT